MGLSNFGVFPPKPQGIFLLVVNQYDFIGDIDYFQGFGEISPKPQGVFLLCLNNTDLRKMLTSLVFLKI
jgi:hypothetical protein